MKTFLERAGIKPRSSSFAGDCSNQKTMAPQPTQFSSLIFFVRNYVLPFNFDLMRNDLNRAALCKHWETLGLRTFETKRARKYALVRVHVCARVCVRVCVCVCACVCA